MTVESLQEIINRKADQKCCSDLYKAFKAIEDAINTAGALHEEIDFELKHQVKVSPQWLLRRLRQHCEEIGKKAYREAEARELLEKLEAVQGQIEELQSNQP